MVIEAQMHMQSAKERVEHLIMLSAKQIIISLCEDQVK